MAYKTVILDLSKTIPPNAPDGLIKIVEPGKRIGNISINFLTPGQTFRLYFGATQMGILIPSIGNVVGAVSKEDTFEGLYYSVDAGVAASIAEITVAWDNVPLPTTL